MKIKQLAAAAAFSLLCHSANATVMTSYFTSSGDAGSTAVGSFSYDDAALTSANVVVLADLISFNWTISNPTNTSLNGQTLVKTDLSVFSADFLSDNFATRLYFTGTNASETFEAWSDLLVKNANWDEIYTNTSSSVPTPSALMLMLSAAGWLGFKRKAIAG